MNIAFFKTKWQPFIKFGGAYASMDLKEVDFSDQTFGFFLGGGVKYNFNDHIYWDLYGLFSSFNFSQNDFNVKIAGFSAATGIGYVF